MYRIHNGVDCIVVTDSNSVTINNVSFFICIGLLVSIVYSHFFILKKNKIHTTVNIINPIA